MEKQGAFLEMYLAAKGMLSGKAPGQIAANARVAFDDNIFSVPSLGKMYHISYPDYSCQEPIMDWHYLVVLHYLNLADGTPVTGEAMPMADMSAGLVRGTKYDRTAAEALTVFLKDKTEEQVKETMQSLGGAFLPGKADLNVMLPFLPRFPLYLNIWFADEEFPPSARLLGDKSAGHYLTIEDAVSVGEVVLAQLR